MVDRELRSGVCVIGRTDFRTGIGTVTSAALELLSRGMHVSVATPREEYRPTVELPSGRQIEVTLDPHSFAFTLFTDVLWNGAGDGNFLHVPGHGVRVAHVAYDSDALPPEWVEILNTRFDAVLFSSSYLEEVARRSGVTIPVGTLPIGLDLEPLLARPVRPVLPGPLRFGAVAAFHERKGLDVLVEAFLLAFEEGEAELVLHSNLRIGPAYERVRELVRRHGKRRVRLSTEDLSDAAKTDLLDSFDVVVSASAGEGYSIPPREALALGKPLVLSGVDAHRDLAGVPGVELVEPAGKAPARYPEIDGRVFGRQAVIDPAHLAAALRRAADFARSPENAATVRDRKRRAAEFSNTILENDYRRIFDPEAPLRPGARGSEFTRLPEPLLGETRRRNGRGGHQADRRKLVLPANDAGFFSVFNSYFSHLVWAQQQSSPPMVLADWDVTRMLARHDGVLKSYCYSAPEDGNLWTSLFEPLYDLDEEYYDDAERLYRHAEIPPHIHNENREPLLTYVNAFELYRAPWFPRFRTQYHRVLRDLVKLRPEYQRELDGITELGGGRFRIAVHVKHPAHAIEQPDGKLAGYDRYLTEVSRMLAEHGVAESGDDWRVFVATDQDRVVERFEQEFGEHVLRFSDVARVTDDQQQEFDALEESAKVGEGHQLQHLRAADASTWSPRLAWEVWRDAEMMAASDVLLHAVSNVATAVSFFRPEVEMVYCTPDD